MEKTNWVLPSHPQAKLPRSLSSVHNQMGPIYVQHCWLTARHLRTEVDVAGHRVGSQQSLRVGVPLAVLQQPGQQ